MHRFYLPTANRQADTLKLEGGEAHHALRVLRLKAGEPVTVLNGAGDEFLSEVEATAKTSLTLKVKECKSTAAPHCAIALLVAVPKGKIIEGIIQKAVELGAQQIIPLLTARVVTHLDDEGAEEKREKWQQVAIEAIKQCGASWLPKVSVPQTIGDFLKGGEHFELPLVGSLQAERRHPRYWINEFRTQHGRLPHSAGIWIGPEGDFTPDELMAIELAGVHPITLGPLTLRVETAVIYSLSFLNYELNADTP